MCKTNQKPWKMPLRALRGVPLGLLAAPGLYLVAVGTAGPLRRSRKTVKFAAYVPKFAVFISKFAVFTHKFAVFMLKFAVCILKFAVCTPKFAVLVLQVQPKIATRWPRETAQKSTS